MKRDAITARECTIDEDTLEPSLSLCITDPIRDRSDGILLGEHIILASH